MKSVTRSMLLIATMVTLAVGLQGCLLAAAGAGAAGGYEAKKHGYEAQSPVKKDESGGYKAQSPIKKNDDKDSSSSNN